ncbi:MAG TPA: type I restriction enzyme endonuclease domain-containing protein, partial [Ktedonobacteraceae bacterium]|nr:type I restriction enzyme endonuclease domain-containing protein [Ktedonobacteraceae bacterium]
GVVSRLYKAILPDAQANEFSASVALFVVLAREIRETEAEPDISDIMSSIEQLLDVSVATRGYIIREASGPYDSSSTVDLSQIDFDALRAHFERSRKHIETEKLRAAIAGKLKRLLQLNRSRVNYQERFQQMIDDYNSGSANVELFFDELVKFARELNQEEQRHMAEQLSEEELAMFDLLTRPDLTLSEKEQEQIKKVVRDLLASLKREKLVLDWRKKQQARAEVRLAVEQALDTGLPTNYTNEMYQRKCEEVFQHIYDSYFGAGQSVYTAA